MDPAMAETLLGLLEAGTHVLLESGAGFLNPAEFTAHQKMLYRYFDIEVAPPVDLWSGKSADDALLFLARPGHRPRTKRGRSRIPSLRQLLLATRDKGPGLQSGNSRVGERRRCDRQGRSITRRVEKADGGGRLIFLGSPLGPALRAGDPQARSWLRLVTAL